MIFKSLDELNKGTVLPIWTTGTRPSVPNVGDIGVNTTLDIVETWNGTKWMFVGGGTDVTATEVGHLAGVTSDIQTQITNAQNTASSAQTTANSKIGAANYATSTVGGTVKARISGSTLYLTTNGNNA